MTSTPTLPSGDGLPAAPLPAAPLAPYIPLLFGDETTINEAGLDPRGRRLLRSLEAAGLATLHRMEFLDLQGHPHVVFSYSLRHAPPRAPEPVVQRALDEAADVYDRLPDEAWHHETTDPAHT